jgi:hypothetical protein
MVLCRLLVTGTWFGTWYLFVLFRKQITHCLRERTWQVWESQNPSIPPYVENFNEAFQHGEEVVVQIAIFGLVIIIGNHRLQYG